MGYEQLKNFRGILNRKDFNFISDEKIIKQISQIIAMHIPFLNTKEKEYKELLSLFCDKLGSFYNWIGGERVPGLKKGFLIIQEELPRCSMLLSESSAKRTLARSYCKKFNKMFLLGLSNLLVGIKDSFDPDFVGITNINANQLRAYILDPVIGLGGKYRFNMIGAYAFMNRIWELNMPELIVVERLLLRPGNQVRTIQRWTDLGERHSPVRILMLKNRIYFLFKANEYAEYQSHLNVPPDEAAFSEAA